MIIKIDSIKNGKIKFDTLTHTGITIPFIKNRLPENYVTRPTLCWFSKEHNLVIAIIETVVNNKSKYEISFIDKRSMTDLKDYFSVDLADKDTVIIDTLNISSLEELISLRWLKMPLNKLGKRNYYNSTSISGEELKSLSKEEFVEQLQQTINDKVNIKENIETIEVDESDKVDIIKEEDNTSKTIFLQVLGLLSQYDSITIPLDVYNKLITVVRKTLSMNTAATIRKTMTTIKFGDTNNIFAIVDYNEEKSLAKVTILKEYNDVQVTDREVEELWVYYKNWNKANSFIIPRR